MVVSSSISYTIGGWYHGDINMHGLGVNRPNDPIGGLNGGYPSDYFLSELPPGESLGCLPSNGWWTKPLST